MSKITSRYLLKRKFFLLTFLILCSLYVSENVFSKTWNSEFTKKTYNPAENAFNFTFDFSDNFTHLFRAETDDQGSLNRMCLKLRSKSPDAEIRSKSSCISASGVKCSDNWDEIYIVVKDSQSIYSPKNIPAFVPDKCYQDTPEADYKDVKSKRIICDWSIIGPSNECGKLINQVDSAVPAKQALKLEVKAISKTNMAKVSKETDAVVIKGAELGENIKVFNISGSEVTSVVTINDVVKIKLPKDQVYIVKIGESYQKVAF